MLLVGVSLFDGDGTHQVNSVTYGGLSLTLVGARRDLNNAVRSEIWRLIAPSSGAANVVVTLNSNSDGFSVAAATFTGVHQTTPLGTAATAQGMSSAASVAVSSASGELVLDNVAFKDGVTLNVGSGQTQRWSLVDATDKQRGAGSTETGAASVTMSWSEAGGNQKEWAIVGVSIKPAATATTTLGNGTDPGGTSLAPGGAATLADAFTVQTSSGTDAITAVTVSLATGTSAGLSLVEITNDAGTVVYGSTSNPASDTPAITLTTNITATTASTQYKVRVTPKSHAAMPAPAGSSYAVTAYVSNWTCTNTHAGSDSGGTTVTIDNLSPANVTAATATAGSTQVALGWTNPGDSDLGSVVVLRRATSAVGDTPTEGATYTVGNTVGSSTVVCVVTAPTANCADTGLTNGTAYHYKLFSKDTNGNYTTGTVPTGSPATPFAGITVTPTSGLTTTEAGGTATFTVVLTSAPASNVAIGLSSSDTTEGMVSPATLTFTSGNWSTAQTVTVTGVDDAVDDGNVAYAIVTASATSSDTGYSGLNASDVSVTTTDDDTAGLTLTQSGGATSVNESGTTDTFTVVLTAQPASNVVVTVTSGDTGEATVSPATLTFTSANWSTPQTVTVTGVKDVLVDGSQVTPITVAVDDANSSNEFDPVADQTVSVTTVDNDTAGITIVESAGSTSVDESGTTDAVTVVLTAQPAANVVLTVTSGDTGEATVSPATVTFTPANWSTPQTVTVTGVNDALVDGNQVTTVTLAVDDATSSNEFDPVADQTVSVTTVDNDTAGITIVESSGSTSVNESGTNDTFTVVLTAQPASNVVLAVIGGDASEATANPAVLTFTPADWSTPQTVTVTGVDDALVDGNQVSAITVAVAAASSSDEFDAVADQTVSVTTVDNDTAGLTIVESGGTTSVNESGTTDTFTVVLTAQPAANVVLTVTSGDTGEATVSPATLTFTSATWNTPQTVTVTGINDALVDGSQVTTITLAVDDVNSSNEFDPVADQTVSVTTVDNDTAGIAIVESGGSTSVNESGTTDTFSVVLTAQPASNVVLTVTSGDTGEATVSPATVTFTSANWSTPQTVTVTGVNDALVDGNQVSTITVSVDDATSSNEFDPVADQTVSVTTVDNDTAGITIVESSGSTSVNESGTTDTVTVALTAQPASDVVLTITSGDTGEATVSPATLTFTSATWNTPQTVTVTGINDALVDGNQVSTITVAVDDASSSDEFDAVADQTVSVTTVDNDSSGITIVESGGSTSVNESGTTDTFTVVLTSQPASNVVLAVIGGDASEATANPAVLTFTPANWNAPQTVTVTGVNDALVDGNQVSTITVAVDDASSSNEFDPVADQTVSVTTVDNDTAGITIVESGGSTSVNESGTTDTFTVVLTVQPASNVVLAVIGGDASEVTATPAVVTFTPANWSTPQTVTVTGVNDALVDGNQVTPITVAVDDASSSDEFDAVADATVSATTVDNDTAGITITESGGSTSVNESGTTDMFTVVLTSQPASNVVLAVIGGDPSEATANPAVVTFTPTNWSTPQTVTVTGVNDALVDGNQVTTITVAVDDTNSSNEFDPVADSTVSVTTVDNDTAGLTIVESGGTTSVNESGTTDTFTVVLTAQPASDVVLTITSGDTGEATVSPATLTFTSATWNTPQTVTVTGINDGLVDGNQVTTITVAVDDANSSNEFDPVADQTVSVTTVDNDTAGIAIVESAGSTSVNESGTTDTFTVALTSQPASNVVLAVMGGDATEATATPAVVTFTPANWNTPQTVTVTGVNDVLVDGNQVTPITVAVADAISSDEFDPVADQTVSVTTVDDDAAGIAIVESSGSTSVNESGTTDTFTVVLTAQPAANVVLTVTSGDTDEATVSPATLTFTSATWNAPQTVTATGVNDVLVDGNQVSTIAVAVDDASSSDEFDSVADQTVSVTTVDNDAAGIAVVESGGTTSVNESGTTDTFTVVLTSQPTSNVVLAVIGGDATEATASPAVLTFTPVNWNTPQTVTVTGVNDALVDGNQVSTITVAVDDASSSDEFDSVADQTVSVTTVDNDTAGLSIVESGGNTSVNESGTTDTFTVALTSQPASNVVLAVIGSDASEATANPAVLTFTPVNWSTPQTVTVTGVNDALVDGNQVSTVTIAVDDASSSDEFDAVADQTVSVTTVDNDAAGLSIVESGGNTTVNESGTTDTFTVALTSQPASNVVLAVIGSDASEATASPAVLTFTSANWSTPQTVTMTGVNDALADGNQVTTITVVVDDASSSDEFDPVADQTVSVTSVDNDAASIAVVESSGSTSVNESGTTDTFTVVLTVQPASNVVLAVIGGDASEVTANPAVLTFTPATWSTPQTVTVTGVNDVLVDGNQVTPITVAVADASSSGEFDSVADQTVAVTTVDNDTAGIAVVESAGSTSVNESGTTDTVTVVLTAQPASDVVLTVTSSDTGEATVSPATLTFTAATWSTPQTVTVTGVNDALVDGNQASAITVAVADASSSDEFDSVADQTVSVTTADNDIAGIAVTESAGSTAVNESGTTDTFTVVLTVQPAANVVLAVIGGDASEATATPAVMTFTPVTWSTPQTVTVTGVNDALVDGNQVTPITIAVADAISSDEFDPVADQTVLVTTVDNDSASISVTPPTIPTTTEGGGTAIITVALTTQPTDDVTIGLSSSDPTEATVSPSVLTFTSANWSAPQTVTVTGVDDALVDGDQGFSVVIAAAVSADTSYAGLDPTDLTITNTDNDSGDIVISPTSGLVTSEAGTTATFTVVLTSAPTADVTVGLSSSDATEGTVSPLSVTFTVTNWSMPRVVTVSGVDDASVDGNTAYVIQTAAAISADTTYSGLNAADVSVTNTDDDAAGVTVTPVSGLTTTEAGASATFGVVLNSQPTVDVTVSLSSSRAAEGTVSPALVTFTPATWSVVQTITVTGVDDPIQDGEQSYQILTGPATSADPLYSGVDPADVSVRNADNDSAGITVTPTSGLTTTETGGAATFTLVLTSQPAADVTIALSSSVPAEGTVSPATITFTTANWSTLQTVTATGVDDDVHDGSVPYSIVTTMVAPGEPTYGGIDPPDVGVVNLDDDVPSIRVMPALGLVTSEAGGSATFAVVLTTRPLANVSIGVTSGNSAEGIVLPAILTFSPSNWNAPQSVTVVGQDDGVADGDVVYTVLTLPASSTDPDYAGLDAADVTVTNADNDVSGVVVTPTQDLVTTEDGGTATFTVVLQSRPSADVQIALSASDSAEGAVAPSSLTFSSASWSVPQVVTVTGVDDAVADGSRSYEIVTDAASADPAYAGVAVTDVSVINVDNDSPGITVTPTSGLVTTEAGQAAHFTIVLNTQPSADVTIGLSSSDTSEGTVAPASVTFTSANWSAPQVVTLTGVDDAIADGSQSYVADTAPAVSADPGYNALDAPNVTAATSDDDRASITVTPPLGLTTTERGGRATFAVVLSVRPEAPVTIPLSSSRADEGTVAPASVTLTSHNWSIPQIVTVTGVDDARADGGQRYTVVTGRAQSADGRFANLDPADVSVTNLDDDMTAVAVSAAGPLVTTEAGGGAAFRIVLSTRPVSSVDVPIHSSNTSEGTASRASVTFTPDNWDVPVEITVTGQDDEVVDGTVRYAIVLGPATSADPAYNGVRASDVTLTNMDNDRASEETRSGPDSPVAGAPETSGNHWASDEKTTEERPLDPPAPGGSDRTAAMPSTLMPPVLVPYGGLVDPPREPAAPRPAPMSEFAEPPIASSQPIADGPSPQGPLPIVRGIEPRTTVGNTALVLSRARSSALSVWDPDRLSHPLVVSLVSQHGTVVLATTTGLRIDEGADRSSNVTFTGTPDAINGALDGLTFVPAPGYTGDGGICVDVSHPPRRSDIASLCVNRVEALWPDVVRGPRLAVWIPIAIEAPKELAPPRQTRAPEPLAARVAPDASPSPQENGTVMVVDRREH